MAARLKFKPGFAPWIEDFDPPDEMTDEEIERACEAAAKFMAALHKKEFDEAQHPRDEHGRFTSDGGDGGGEDTAHIMQHGNKLVVFHGTSKAAVKSIMENGLVPHGSAGADKWAAEHGMLNVAEEFTAGDRKLNVYFADTPDHALMFAKAAAEVRKSKPAVIAITIPVSKADNIKWDEHGEAGMFQYKGTIKPEWIKGELEIPKEAIEVVHKPVIEEARRAAEAAEGQTVYAIVFEPREEDDKKDFDPSQPRDETGKWTDGGGGDGGKDEGGPATVSVKRVHEVKPELASVAQKEYDEWVPDEEGIDEEVGGGGICDSVCSAMASVLAAEGIEVADAGQEGDEHAWLLANLKEGVYEIDIPPGVYETGGGYKWTKIPDVTITADDVVVSKLHGPMTDADFQEQYQQRAFDESQHPRDETGKWTGGGGGDAKPYADEPAAEAIDKSPGSKHWYAVTKALMDTATKLGLSGQLVIKSGADEKPVGEDKNGRQLKPAAYADLRAKTIIAFPDNIESVETVPGVLSHEASHLRYETVLHQYAIDKATISRHPSLVNQSGYLKPQFEDRYPAYAALWKYETQIEQLVKDDGVTNYSKAWWNVYSGWHPSPREEMATGKHLAQRDTAMHETVAEIGRLETTTGKREGVNELWSDYYDDVQTAYKARDRYVTPR